MPALLPTPPRPLLAVAALALAGCPPEYDPVPQARILVTDPLADAGSLAVNDRRTVGLELRSQGPAPVTVSDVQLSSDTQDEVFVLLPWQDDGEDTLRLAGGSEASPATATLQLSFRPVAAGSYRALLSIHSDDSQVEDGIWQVALRGLALHPCGRVAPGFVDLGPQDPGGLHDAQVQVSNCGQVTLTLTGFDLDGDTSFSVETTDPVYVEPGTTASVDIAWVPGSSSPEQVDITLLSNDPEHELEVSAVGNDCEASVLSDWDDDGDGWTSCGGDCDDGDDSVSPSALEIANGQDDDCDGEVDEEGNPPGSDDDADGSSEDEGDCDDADPQVGPHASESIDQVDNDCNGLVDDGTECYDDDGDGLAECEGDCDDADSAVHPGATEADNGQDDDCDGSTDEGFAAYDDDGDGYTEDEGDCDDADAWTSPAGTEDCDEVDNDCDGWVDEGEACAYLSERSLDTGLGEPGGCATSGRRRVAGLLASLLVLLGITARRRGYHWLER